MKTKKISKFRLNKITVANLGISKMKNVKGGGYTDSPCLPSAECTPVCPSEEGATCAHETDSDTNLPFCTASDRPDACVSGWHTDCSCN